MTFQPNRQYRIANTESVREEWRNLRVTLQRLVRFAGKRFAQVYCEGESFLVRPDLLRAK